MILTYYITTILLMLMLCVVIGYEYCRGRQLTDGAFRLRRRSFLIFFFLFLLSLVPRLFSVDHGRLEIFPTMTICLDYAAFVAFTMLAAAYFGRKHYRNPYNWFFLLQLPVLLVIINIVMRLSGYYHPIYQMADAALPHDADDRIIYLSRVVWIGLVLLAYLFLMAMLLEAYFYGRRMQVEQVSNLETKQNTHEHGNILLYVTILVLTMLSNFCPLPPFHIFCNIAMTLMVAWSLNVYCRFVLFTELKEKGQFSAAIVEDALRKYRQREDKKAVFPASASLQTVADILHVSAQELSDYIYTHLDTSFSAWMSEQKLCLCAHLLKTTDRMISDIALSTGYSNVPAMNRAFKIRFGVTPSQYRKNKGVVTEQKEDLKSENPEDLAGK